MRLKKFNVFLTIQFMQISLRMNSEMNICFETYCFVGCETNIRSLFLFVRVQHCKYTELFFSYGSRASRHLRLHLRCLVRRLPCSIWQCRGSCVTGSWSRATSFLAVAACRCLPRGAMPWMPSNDFAFHCTRCWASWLCPAC